MKFQYYVAYGAQKGLPEGTSEAFKKFAAVLKKYNVELVMWGPLWDERGSDVHVEG